MFLMRISDCSLVPIQASAYSSLIQSENVERKHKAKMNSKTGEPKFTNFGSGHPRTLDYIFYTGTVCNNT